MLRKNKPKDRKGKIVLVNASRQFRKGTPKNYLTEAAVKMIATSYLRAEAIDGFVTVITTDDAEKNDFNLSPSRYLSGNDRSKPKELSAALAAYDEISQEEAVVTKELDAVLMRLRSTVE